MRTLRQLGPPLLVGLALRVAWVLFSPNEPLDDQVSYLHGAETLADGRGYLTRGGYPMGLWPPGYSAYVTPFFRAFGVSLTAATLANLSLAGLGITGMWFAGNAAFAAGARAAWLYALYPSFVMMANVWGSESAYCALVPWLLWCTLTLRPLALALVIAAMAYVRSPALLLLGLAPFTRWRWSPAVVAIVLALLLPWGLRNQRELGVFSLTSFNGGLNLWIGNHEGGDGGLTPLPREVRELPVVEVDHTLRERALGFVRAHPLRYLGLSLNRVQLSLRSDTSMPDWSRERLEYNFGPHALLLAKLVCSAAYWTLVLAAAYAIFQRRRAWGRTDMIMLATFLLLAAPFVLILGSNRFALPLYPLLMCWAASGTFVRCARSPS